MRKALFFLTVFGLVGILCVSNLSAQSGKSKRIADVGTWEMNIAASKFAPSFEAAIKEATIVVRELDSDFEYTQTGTRTDGSPITVKWTVPKQGGIWKYQQGGSGEKTTIIRTVISLDPGEWYDTELQDGKQVEVRHVIVSKDGKMMRQTEKGTAFGKPYESIVIYEKQ